MSFMVINCYHSILYLVISLSASVPVCLLLHSFSQIDFSPSNASLSLSFSPFLCLTFHIQSPHIFLFSLLFFLSHFSHALFIYIFPISPQPSSSYFSYLL